MNTLSTRAFVAAVASCVAGLILIATVYSSAADRAAIASFNGPPPSTPPSPTPDLVPPLPPASLVPTPPPSSTPVPAPAHRPPVVRHLPTVPKSTAPAPLKPKPTLPPRCPA